MRIMLKSFVYILNKKILIFLFIEEFIGDLFNKICIKNMMEEAHIDY